jgi:hypothetical protein
VADLAGNVTPTVSTRRDHYNKENQHHIPRFELFVTDEVHHGDIVDCRMR